MRLSLVPSLALVLAMGCRGDGGPGSTQGELGSTSSVPEQGVTVVEPSPATSTTAADPSGEPVEDTGRTTGTTEGSSFGVDAGSSGSTGRGDGTAGSESSAGEATDGDVASDCAFSESFDGLPDGSAWPPPWVATGGVMLADVQGGRGRMLPVTGPYALARMFAPLPLHCIDVEGTLMLELTDGHSSGVGLYLRQNGGYLEQTEPPGEGYVAFVQAFGLASGIGAWREVDGVESTIAPYTPIAIAPGIVYAVRFRVTQQGVATTRLRARMWPVEGMEPGVWHVDVTDASPSLQGVGGGLAIDVWSQLRWGVPPDVFVDSIVVGPAP